MNIYNTHFSQGYIFLLRSSWSAKQVKGYLRARHLYVLVSRTQSELLGSFQLLTCTSRLPTASFTYIFTVIITRAIVLTTPCLNQGCQGNINSVWPPFLLQLLLSTACSYVNPHSGHVPASRSHSTTLPLSGFSMSLQLLKQNSWIPITYCSPPKVTPWLGPSLLVLLFQGFAYNYTGENKERRKEEKTNARKLSCGHARLYSEYLICDQDFQCMHRHLMGHMYSQWFYTGAAHSGPCGECFVLVTGSNLLV